MKAKDLPLIPLPPSGCASGFHCVIGTQLTAKQHLVAVMRCFQQYLLAELPLIYPKINFLRFQYKKILPLYVNQMLKTSFFENVFYRDHLFTSETFSNYDFEYKNYIDFFEKPAVA